jgi:hypothetical protein
MKQLTDIDQSISAIYHPVKAPGALQKDWNFLKQMITRRPPQQVLHDIKYDPDTIPDIKLPQEDLYSRFPGAATSAQAAPTLGVILPGGTYNVRPAPEAMTKQQRELMARRDDARQQAELDVSAYGGLSPQQKSQQTLADINRAMNDWNVERQAAGLGPATSAEKVQFLSDLVSKQYGVTPAKENYFSQIVTTKDTDGTEHYWRVPQDESKPPEEVDFSGQQMVPKIESADVRKRADYAAYVKAHPGYDKTFEQWSVEQAQQGRLAVPTSRDDRYIAIEQKKALGQSLTADEQAYTAAYDLYISKRVIAPILTRAAAFADDRFVPVMDPNDPEKVVLMRAADAARAGVGTPASIGFQTDKAVTRFMTAGKGAENIGYFNTATDHLKLLGEVADALNNGDVQALNKAANAYAAATGDPAPTNFETVTSAVAGELSKTFKGTGATNEEIALINQTINSAMSPYQLHGAIDYYTRLMNGKLNAMRAQLAAGKQGLPAFPENIHTPPAAHDTAQPQSGGSVSLAAAMQVYRQNHPGEKNISKQTVIDDLKKHKQAYVDDVK